MNKYRLSDDTRLWQWKNGETTHSTTLRQIIATAEFNDVTIGTKGGWIDDECALAQDGDCWIYDENSVVFAGATVSGNRARLTCLASSATKRISATIAGWTRLKSAMEPE